ncbi:TPA: hypothetical protein ACGR18_004088 [Escherichia coli]
MHIPQNFLPRSRQKLLRSAPGQSFPAVAVMPLAAKVLKQVMVNTGGNKEQVSAPDHIFIMQYLSSVHPEGFAVILDLIDRLGLD